MLKAVTQTCRTWTGFAPTSNSVVWHGTQISLFLYWVQTTVSNRQAMQPAIFHAANTSCNLLIPTCTKSRASMSFGPKPRFLAYLHACRCSVLLTGSISCWHGTACTSSADSKTHHAKVTTLVWSGRQAAVLASGDEAGRLVLWRLEATANLSLLMHFDAAAAGSISHIVFAQESGAAAACLILIVQPNLLSLHMLFLTCQRTVLHTCTTD